MFETILFFWPLLAILVGAYSHSKGYSWFAGFFISLVFSPLIGFIFFAVSQTNVDVLEKRRLEAGDMKRCPECAELVKAEAKKCRHCGKMFEEKEPEVERGKSRFDFQRLSKIRFDFPQLKNVKEFVLLGIVLGIFFIAFAAVAFRWAAMQGNM
jgi:zinc-ribbon domain